MALDNSASWSIDPHLPEFIRTKVNTLVKWDLVYFFHKNPHTVDTAENIAGYTTREVPTVAAELAELADAGVLRAKDIGGKKIYALTDEPSTRELIRAFVLACDNRDFRMQAIRQITTP